MNAIPEPGFSGEDFLAWEALQPVKHEFLAGEVYAMAGARDAHVTIAGNVFMLLRAHTRGTACRTYIADMKLRVEEVDAYFYPDVFVTCDPRDLATDTWKSHARLVVEVLSDSTAGFDRGRKFQSYRLLGSLQEYVLIDAEARTVDVFRRAEGGCWVLHPFEGEDTAEFQSLECRAPLALIFEDVRTSPIEGHPDDARPVGFVPPIHS
jgi:Uma2 family endonuclease